MFLTHSHKGYALKYRIIGADLETAQSVELVVDTNSRDELVGIARNKGILISDIIELDQTELNSELHSDNRIREQMLAEKLGVGVKELQENLKTGRVVGLLAGFGCVIPIGVLLCLTGIGICLGIPLIFAGLILPVIMPFMLLNEAKDKHKDRNGSYAHDSGAETTPPFSVKHVPARPLESVGHSIPDKQAKKLTENTLDLTAYWLETPIKLNRRYETPGGSKVTTVNACVDICYAIRSNEYDIISVTESNSSSIMGSSHSINYSSKRTGEAWYETYLCTKQQLYDATISELGNPKSGLRSILDKKRKFSERQNAADSMAAALNSNADFEEIERIYTSAKSAVDLSFTYTKDDCSSEIRMVTVVAIKGKSLRARDHKDQRVKSFRIDRISEVSQA